ncbi:porin family protein [Hymenobacter sp. APR13]|uniref:porin family protein n=1 Tax=Hymenobacter sp. APR13 TaxID=1356852 RepID=UPI0004E0A1D9|nr:porin family protein [Hymenobacter sp. APR13]AII52766.1 hypothetical protein N008_12370 [Hymenobacter sp. APR13]
MKSLFTALLGMATVTLATPAAEAQISFGPRIGANFADFRYHTQASYVLNSQMRLGAQAGVAANIGFGNFAFQPALLYSQKGYRVDLEDSSPNRFSSHQEELRLNYLEVPLNVVYTANGATGLQVFAGPYFGLALSGKGKEELKYTTGSLNDILEGKYDVEFAEQAGTDNSKAYYRRLDLGATFGVGYKVDPMQAQLGYAMGISNIAPNDRNNDEPRDKIRNRNLQLSLTYFFGAE